MYKRQVSEIPSRAMTLFFKWLLILSGLLFVPLNAKDADVLAAMSRDVYKRQS